MMKKIIFNCIIITCIFRAQAFASSVAGTVEKGNRLYGDKKYEDASKYYDQALAKQPDSAIINFDAGAAQYKTKEYQKADSSFEKSLITEDNGLEAKANYNLGNSKYMLGLSKENADLSAAVQLLEGALNNYKRTQELTPKDEDVKVNYKIVEEKLREFREKLKQQPQENKNNQKQQAQKQQGESQQKEEQPSGQVKSPDQSSQQQSASTQHPAITEEPVRASAQQEQPAAAQYSTLPEESERASSQSQESKEMSKKEANMLLEGYRQEENTTGMLKDDRKGTEEKVLRDW